jgi:methyl-accepting chemotaxis protein
MNAPIRAISTDFSPSTTSPGFFSQRLSQLSLAAKMNLLTLLMLVLSLAGGLFNAQTARQTVQDALEQSLEDQVSSYHAILDAKFKEGGEEALMNSAKALLPAARWGENNAGYLFLADADGSLEVFPPNPALAGQKPDSAGVVDETGLNLSQTFAQAVRGGQPMLVHYDFLKPGTDITLEKVSYLMPVGNHLLAAGIYLDQAEAAYSRYLWQSMWIMAASMLGMLLLVQLIARTMRQQVNTSLDGLRRIANRILDQGTQVWGKDEFAGINRELEQTRLNLAELLHHQHLSAGTVASASLQMDTGVHQVTQAVHDQQQQLDELASAMEQMSTSIRDVASQAAQSASETRISASSAHDGEAKIQQAINAMQVLCGELAECSDGINRVQQQVDAIGKVVETISAISGQTNLLALNAAIEAARAGEQGRGFAVVADEVRTLASRTQAATGDIGNMIAELQKHTGVAVSRMGVSVDQAQNAMSLSDAATGEFSNIATQTRTLTEHSEQIAAASEEQSVVANQVTQSLLRIREAVEETSHVLEELSTASNALSGEAQALEKEVGQYRLPA